MPRAPASVLKWPSSSHELGQGDSLVYVGRVTRPSNSPNNAVFALILFVLGGAGFGIGVWGLSNAWATRDWVEVTADVVQVERETYTYTNQRASGGSFEEEGERLRCTFAFTVGSERYTSDRYSHLEAWDEYTQGTVAELNERVARLETGTVTAYYNPCAPNEAVLLLPEKAPPTFVLCAGLIMLALSLRSALKWRKARRLALAA